MSDSDSDSDSVSDSMCDDTLGSSESPSTASANVCEDINDQVSDSEFSKENVVGTQDDDTADFAEVNALEDLPLVDIGTRPDWNFFNIAAMIESKVCIEQKERFFDALYSKLESKVTADRERNMFKSHTEPSLLLITEKMLEIQR